MNTLRQSVINHQNVPPDYYETSIKTNLGQRYWHHRRFQEVLKLIRKDPKAIILDVGSADGTFSRILFNRIKPKKLVGIDVLPSSVDYANKKFARQSNVKFKVADAHKLPFADNTFTGAFCLEVLEHILKPDKVIKELKRVLKSNGYVIALVPSENHLFKIIWWFWTKSKGRIWDEAHVQQFSNGSLKDCFIKQGFVIDDEHTFLLNMLYIIKARKP